MNKLIISGEVTWDTKKTDMNEAIDELFNALNVLYCKGLNLEIDITKDCWLVDENGNEVDEEEEWL